MIAETDHANLVPHSGIMIGQKRSKYGRILLLVLFVILFLDAIPGFGLGIVRGLSAQNLYLYVLCFFIVARAVANPSGFRFVDLDIHVPFLAMMLYTIGTLVVAGMFEPTYNEVRGVVAFKNRLLDLYLLFIVSRYLVSSYEDFLWLLRALIVIVFVSVFLTLIDFVNLVDIEVIDTFKGRVEGPFGDANQFGGTLAFLLPVAIGTMPSGSAVGRWMWRVGILAMTLLLLGTGSRGAYVGVIAGSLISLVYFRDYLDIRTIGKVTAIAVVLFTLLGLGLAFFKQELVMQIFEKSTSGNIETASSGRWAIWSAAFGVMLEAPYSFVFGYGWNTFETSGIWKSAHSEYINWYFETGLIGLAIFMTLILSIIRRSRGCLRGVKRGERQHVISFAVGMIILSIDIAFVQLYNSWSIAWVVIGLVIGMQAVLSESTDESAFDNIRRARLDT